MLFALAGFYDVALYLVKQYPDLVMEKNYISSQTRLQTLAAKPNAFQSGCMLGFWQQIIYSREPFSLVNLLRLGIASIWSLVQLCKCSVSFSGSRKLKSLWNLRTKKP
ncbi:hypothetical protein POM88_044923 [Heracleum sosnowskyi]|uniref:Uncharacterized protein n=1 Tax=Heracleum sosnowskyi TaxID=360622 RepID=A0AAD8H6A9_9APIA|nr:hypothetical protein POM88_044923 [Heracleum sosnowskyi]